MYDYMVSALSNQDALDKLERLHFYNWVQDARAVAIDGKLTKAGKYFADYNAKLAYTKTSEFVHSWKIAPPLPFIEYSSDYQNVNLKWYDHNGETGKSYTVFRKDTKTGEATAVATLLLGKDYVAGETITYSERVGWDEVPTYYVQATSYKDEKSLNSREITVDSQLLKEGVKEISDNTPSDGLKVAVNGASIIITSDANRSVNIFSIDGKIVKSVNITKGENTINDLPKGIYLISGHKINL